MSSVALRRAIQQFQQSHGRAPRLEEQAAAIGASVAQVQHLLQATQPLASLDQPVGVDDLTLLGDVIAAPTEAWDADLIGAEQRQALSAALEVLTEQERTILTLRYRIGEACGAKCRTLADVGQLLGITRERVRQVEAKALSKLRDFLTDPDM